MRTIVEIACDTKEWDEYSAQINESLFILLVTKILSLYPSFSVLHEVEISILLTSDENMRNLNKKFRQQDKPTNVLSFPDQDFNWRKLPELQLSNKYLYLGDIAFGYQIIHKEAKQQLIDPYDHFRHLAVHSILHLIGYDHMGIEEAEAMEALEVKILYNCFAMKSPYL